MAHRFEFVLAAITLLLGRVFLATCTDMPEHVGQEQCDGAEIVGNSAAKEEGSPRASRSETLLYLDTENPASCTGNITTWTFCYYYTDPGGDPDGASRSRTERTRSQSSKSSRGNSNMQPAEDSRSIVLAIYRQTATNDRSRSRSTPTRSRSRSQSYERVDILPYYTTTLPGT